MACGADFKLQGAHPTMLKSKVPVVAVVAVRTGIRQEPDLAQSMSITPRSWEKSRCNPSSNAVRQFGKAKSSTIFFSRRSAKI
jgi:hypothetical protein